MGGWTGRDATVVVVSVELHEQLVGGGVDSGLRAQPPAVRVNPGISQSHAHGPNVSSSRISQKSGYYALTQ